MLFTSFIYNNDVLLFIQRKAKNLYPTLSFLLELCKTLIYNSIKLIFHEITKRKKVSNTLSSPRWITDTEHVIPANGSRASPVCTLLTICGHFRALSSPWLTLFTYANESHAHAHKHYIYIYKAACIISHAHRAKFTVADVFRRPFGCAIKNRNVDAPPRYRYFICVKESPCAPRIEPARVVYTIRCARMLMRALCVLMRISFLHTV